MEFISYAFPIVYKFKEAYRFLNYGDKNDIAIRDEERIDLSKFFGKDHNLDISTGFNEGDFVKITSGVLEGNENKTVRVNKNRNEAVIEVSMFRRLVMVSVGLEIVEKIGDVQA